MKKFKFMKATVLFLLCICAISVLVIALRTVHLRKRQNEMKESVISSLEKVQEDDVKDNIIFSNRRNRNYSYSKHRSRSTDIPRHRQQNFKIHSTDILKILVFGIGNVVLASHNEGSYAHYFSRIKELENGEEIIYITNMGERRYSIYENKVIKETNVDIIKNTKENIITLVTCVTGRRNERQCVIGIEKK